jgi:hypothetical protein
MTEWEAAVGETPIDPSGLVDPTISNPRPLNEAEGRAIARVVYRYLLGTPDPETAPFDFSWGLSLHREMFGRVWRWAGKTRRIDLNIGVPWAQVETQLFEFFLRLPYWKEMPLLEHAARLHPAGGGGHSPVRER